MNLTFSTPSLLILGGKDAGEKMITCIGTYIGIWAMAVIGVAQRRLADREVFRQEYQSVSIFT